MPAERVCVFVDRDGTLCEDADYLSDPDGVRLLDGAAAGVAALNAAGALVVVATNQSGVARGYFAEECVAEVNKRLVELLAAAGARVDGVYYCPHHPGGKIGKFAIDCRCRKPGPGMLEQAAREMGIDLAASFAVGDKESDVLLKDTAGLRDSALVLTGYGRAQLEKMTAAGRRPGCVAEGFGDAARWILEQLTNRKT